MDRKKTIKTILSICLAIVLSFVLVVTVYLGYVFLSYSRIEDNTQLTPSGAKNEEAVKTEEIYTAFIHNLGFGAYTQDFTFFMDGGTQSWAASEESVIDCINKGIETAKKSLP